MGCEWKCHFSQHFVKCMKRPQKSPFLFCGMISECIICFPLWDSLFFFFFPINWISAVEHFAAWGRPAQGMA